ncbi:MAG: InlB B-repeat-containing protein [Clostridia bacterium]|nr:InlB B-repeat-containing protein [Clostridia bacterium]
MKKFLSLFLTVLMLVSTITIGVSAANSSYTDTKTHWASDCIESWSGYGVIKGYDGKFSPDRSMTRGEFAVVLDRILKYQTAAENVFKDLKQDFYTDAILKLNKSQVMKGDGDTVRPNATITREESAVMLCRALGIAEESTISKNFSDKSKVSSWATGFINAMVNSGLLNGSDGKLNPQKPITRAEVVKILDNAVVPVLTAGERTNISTNKIVVISASGVTIKDSYLGGKVIVTQGVTEGQVSLSNTRLMGKFTVDNARTGFVKLEDCIVSDGAVLKNSAVVNNGSVVDNTAKPTEPEEDKETDDKKTEETEKDNNNSSGGGGGGGGGDTPTTTKYTITFNSNGGSTVASQTVNSGSKVATPVVPTKANYSFTGWYTDSACKNKYNFDTKVTKSFTLYAGWEEVKVPCTVSFDTDGGSTVASQTVNKGSKVIAPAQPTKANHSFTGWYTDSACKNKYNFDTAVTTSFTLYAGWEEVESFVVSFDTDGGSEVSSQILYSGSKATRPADPTKDEYIFVNWYKDSALSTVYNFNTTVTSDITIYAKWKKVHTVTFVNLDTDMNQIDDDFVQRVEDGKKATEPGFKDVSGYQNTGWYTDESFTEEYSFKQTVNDDITLYGQWVNIAEHNEEPIEKLRSIIDGLDDCIADTATFPFAEMIEILEEVQDCIDDAVNKAIDEDVLLNEDFINKNFGGRINAVSYMTEALNDIPVENYPDGYMVEDGLELEDFFFVDIESKLGYENVQYILNFFGQGGRI